MVFPASFNCRALCNRRPSPIQAQSVSTATIFCFGYSSLNSSAAILILLAVPLNPEEKLRCNTSFPSFTNGSSIAFASSGLTWEVTDILPSLSLLKNSFAVRSSISVYVCPSIVYFRGITGTPRSFNHSFGISTVLFTVII